MLIRRRKEAQVSAYNSNIHSNGMSWIVKMCSKSCIRRDEEQEEKKSKYSNLHAGGQVSQQWIKWPKRWWKMKDLDGGQLAHDTHFSHVSHVILCTCLHTLPVYMHLYSIHCQNFCRQLYKSYYTFYTHYSYYSLKTNLFIIHYLYSFTILNYNIVVIYLFYNYSVQLYSVSATMSKQGKAV